VEEPFEKDQVLPETPRRSSDPIPFSSRPLERCDDGGSSQSKPFPTAKCYSHVFAIFKKECFRSSGSRQVGIDEVYGTIPDADQPLFASKPPATGGNNEMPAMPAVDPSKSSKIFRTVNFVLNDTQARTTRSAGRVKKNVAPNPV